MELDISIRYFHSNSCKDSRENIFQQYVTYKFSFRNFVFDWQQPT